MGEGVFKDFGVEVRNGKVIHWETETTYDRAGRPNVVRTEKEGAPARVGEKRKKDKKKTD